MTTKDHNDDFPIGAFARGPQTIFGVLDDSIDFRVSGDSKIEWMKEARRRGFTSVADFIRVTMEKEVHGEAHVMSMFAQLIRGNGTPVGQVPDKAEQS